jgi:hypothetical protein
MKLEKVQRYTICLLKKRKFKAMELSSKEILCKITLFYMKICKVLIL